jgi:NTP pyrophosphatase (non-canonical NTP hydrolase)
MVDRVEMTMNMYQDAALKTAIYPRNFSIIYPVLKMNGEAGECAEKVGKWMRDGECKIENLDMVALAKELGDVLWYVAAAAADLGLSLETIASMNIDKLASRAKNAKLQGSGDDR